ncbi:hypothetical protein J2S65_000711 [Rhodococcus fascians]|nr:hypothetical protein [Rhodococcus fascians]
MHCALDQQLVLACRGTPDSAGGRRRRHSSPHQSIESSPIRAEHEPITAVSHFDNRMVSAIEWAPFGGGTARDIDAVHALTVTAFYEEVLSLADSEEYRRMLPRIVLERVTETARLRLRLERNIEPTHANPDRSPDPPNLGISTTR